MRLFKRTISSLLVILFAGIIVFNLAKLMPSKKVFQEPNIQTSVFNNGFFDYNIDNSKIDSITADQATTKFSVLQTIIVEEMNNTSITTSQRDSNLVSRLTTAIAGRRIAIENAEDLYNFSMIVSYNWSKSQNVLNEPHYQTIQLMLNQHYILVDDIDYSSYVAKRFNPIGIDLDLPDAVNDRLLPFTGTFDGQGFTISNLYLSDYNYITMVHKLDAEGENLQDFPLIESYSMFSNVGVTGVVKNFTLINPTYELMDAPEGLTKSSMVVGVNEGLIYNIGVIDTKTNQTGTSLAGIRFNVQFSQSTYNTYTAGGFVHTNASTGKIYNSYIISSDVISPLITTRFETKPFFYTNSGTIENVGYDQTMVPNVTSTVQNSTVYVYTRSQFRSGLVSASEPIKINDTALDTLYNESIMWYYYVSDGYPSLFGLTYDTDHFQISNGLELMMFRKMIDMTSAHESGVNYHEATYKLVNDIDMQNYSGYTAPKTPFNGQFIGGTSNYSSSPTNSNYYIYHFNITKPTIISSNYYMGLFSTIGSSGIVKNLNLIDNTITLTDTLANYGRVFNIGAIAGSLSGGTITNVVSNTAINLGDKAIGRTYAGGIVGLASGSVTYNANLGNINGNSHDFGGLTINATFSIGGIVGATASQTLLLTNSVNFGAVSSVGLIDGKTFNVTSGTKVTNRTGGIIGEITNASGTNHSILYLTNHGTINALKFTGKSLGEVENYLGGVFGQVLGNKFTIFDVKFPGTVNEEYVFRNGRWQNSGTMSGGYVNTYTKLYTAGIGVASTTQTKSEFSYMTNSGTYLFTDFDMGTDNQYIYYSATILDKTTGGVVLSRAYNTADFTYDSSYFINSKGLTITTIKIAPFFVSLSTQDKELKYVDNRGSITIGNGTNITEVGHLLQVAGITLTPKVDYTNVTSSSNISLLKINNTASEVFVAGVTYVLPYNTANSRAYLMENVSNKGRITITDFQGASSITSHSGTAGSASSFQSDFVSRNLYVAGLVNLNVGRITNSINLGDISGAGDISNTVIGTANTFAGGISTINYNDIQDSANMGKIVFTNTSTGTTNVSSGSDPLSGSALFAGLVYSYTGGIVLGGISALMADTNANILTDYGKGASITAEVLDTSNNGDIYAKANAYVRVGGIIGVALGLEITAGTDNATSSNAVKRFSSNVTGSQDPVSGSLVSNGLNFGNITAITNTIHTYSTGSTGLAQRPGIFASAGGVVGYGLFRMKRMLNHGVVSSTDVAGGIVGGTYIVGSTASTSIPVTIVDIDTAVHYGKVKAAKRSQYSSFSYANSKEISNTTYFYPDNDAFLFPSGITSRNIANKPGFGGIFGRLQRGTYGLMESTNFINILNMDEAIDMVGRTDQNTLGSFIYYRFSVPGREDTYYTARSNDTSPSSIVGYLPAQTTRRYTIQSASRLDLTIQRTSNWYGYSYEVTAVRGNSVNYLDYQGLTRYVGTYLDPNLIDYSYITNNVNNTVPISGSNTQYTGVSLPSTSVMVSNERALSNFGLTSSNVSGLTYTNNTATYSVNNYNRSTLITLSTISETDYRAEVVTDNELETTKTYIFDNDFPLKDPAQSNYIYEASIDILADRFKSGGSNYKSTRQAMYVLASSKGREAGAVLPQNIAIDKFFDINEDLYQYVDLDNPRNDNLINDPISNSELLSKYRSMFQVKFADKSSVLPISGTSLADLVLVDPNGFSPTLEGGTLDTVNNKITFEVSQSAFPSNTVNYEVESATLSENAAIANFNSLTDDHETFMNSYIARTTNQLGGDYKVEFLNQTFDGNNEIKLYLTVYAEVAAMDESLVDTYKTTYEIIIRRKTDTLAVSLIDIILDGDNQVTVPTLSGTNYTLSSQFEMSPNGTIEAVFDDTTNLLSEGHTMTIRYLMKGATVIDSMYYSSSISPNVSGIFGFEMMLSDALESGVYTIGFSYYKGSQIYTLQFTKASPSGADVLGVSYPTYSFDLEGNTVFTTQYDLPTGNITFETFMTFGFTFNGVLSTSRGLSIIPNTIETELTYVNDVESYELWLDGNYLSTLTLSPFSELTDATILYQYTASGKRQYVLTYSTLTGENEDTIIHTITERDLPGFEKYKNGNQQFNDLILVEREALMTAIRIDFLFAYANLYSDVVTTITDINGLYTPTPDKIEFFQNQFFEIDITYLLEPGSKNYAFKLHREGDIYFELGDIDIEKSLGINAYLQDISFKAGDEIVIYYPEIYQINADGSIVTGSVYDPRVVFEGIFYNNSDTDGVRYFRVDGFVSSEINIGDFSPTFSLPFGAIIQRQVGENVWTDELRADYSTFDEEVDTVVRYRVLPEAVVESAVDLYVDLADSRIVYYDVTAFDLTNILTVRFSLHFRFADGTIVDAGDATSPIKNSAILINMKNYYLKQGVTYPVVVGPTGDITYPYEGGVIDYVGADLDNNPGTPLTLIQNQATMFYFPLPPGTNNYIQTFARNTAGVYSFSVVAPKYSGVNTETLKNGLRYTYNIYLKTGASGGTQLPWNHSNYLLPNFDSTGEIVGKYYYQPGALRLIIREFAIVIEESTIGDQWGLYDDYTSFDEHLVN